MIIVKFMLQTSWHQLHLRNIRVGKLRENGRTTFGWLLMERRCHCQRLHSSSITTKRWPKQSTNPKLVNEFVTEMSFLNAHNAINSADFISGQKQNVGHTMMLLSTTITGSAPICRLTSIYASFIIIILNTPISSFNFSPFSSVLQNNMWWWRGKSKPESVQRVFGVVNMQRLYILRLFWLCYLSFFWLLLSDVHWLHKQCKSLT